MIEYYNDILGIEVRWLAGTKDNPYAGKVMSYYSYKDYVRRNKIEVIRQAHGKGRTALVRYDSLPDAIKDKIIEILGKSPYEIERYHYFKKYIKDDADARTFFVEYRKPDGSYLSDKKRLEYYRNAIILNAVIDFVTDNKRRRRAMGSSRYVDIWANVSKIINELRDEYKHTLPKTGGSLRNKVSDYKKRGYEAIISGKYGNKNRQKVSNQLEGLIVSLHVMEGKPYEDQTWQLYIDFITGEEELFVKSGDRKGEIINPAEFYDENGPVLLSKSTVRNILKRNKHITMKKRNDWLYYNNIYRPHRQRKSPEYSLSKFTFDDRDLPPLLKTGGHVKAYFVWDVASTAIVGVAFSRDKDKDLFIEAMRATFRNLHKMGMGIPEEIEVEHHLVERFKDELALIFHFVHFAEAGNAQEKRAEHFNKIFKYKYEKKYFPTGRFYAKSEANRPKQKKRWTEEGMEDVQRKYDYEEVLNIYAEIINEYNNDEHPDIKGKTRLEVLKEKQNPNARQLPMPVIAKSFGYRTKTSLRRSQYFRVQYSNYGLPSPYYIKKFDTDSSVIAYWIPDADGNIPEIYVFQDDRYIATCKKIERYNEALAERTEEDIQLKQEQDKYVAQFDKMVKDDTEQMMLSLGVLPKIEAQDDNIEDEEDYVYEVADFEPTEDEEATEDLIYSVEQKANDF